MVNRNIKAIEALSQWLNEKNAHLSKFGNLI
jgi:hypothetical protein